MTQSSIAGILAASNYRKQPIRLSLPGFLLLEWVWVLRSRKQLDWDENTETENRMLSGYGWRVSPRLILLWQLPLHWADIPAVMTCPQYRLRSIETWDMCAPVIWSREVAAPGPAPPRATSMGSNYSSVSPQSILPLTDSSQRTWSTWSLSSNNSHIPTHILSLSRGLDYLACTLSLNCVDITVFVCEADL